LNDWQSHLPDDEVYWGQKGAGPDNNLITSDEAKFQLDANLGLLAAVVEALLQRYGCSGLQ
jgi:hypothetical protein